MVDIPFNTIGENISDEIYSQLQNLYGSGDPGKLRAQMQSMLGEGDDPLSLISSEIMSPEVEEQALAIYLEAVSAAGEPLYKSADLSLLRKRVAGLADAGESGKRALQEIFELILAQGYRFNPERVARIAELVTEHLPSVKPVKIPTVKETELSFGLEITGVSELVSSFSSKRLLKRENVKEMMKIVYSNSALQAVEDAIGDIIQAQLDEVEQDMHKNYRLAVSYNQVLVAVESDIGKIIEDITVKRQRQLLVVESLLKSENVSSSRIVELVEITMNTLDKLEADLRNIYNLADSLSNEFIAFLRNNRMANFKADPDNIVGISDILTNLQNVLIYLDDFIREVYTRIEAVRNTLGGDITSGLIFYTISSILRSIEYKAENFIQLMESIRSGTVQKSKIDVDMALKNKARMSKTTTWYDMTTETIGPNAVNYIFHIADDMTTSLRVIGMDKDLVDELRYKVSDVIFNRTNLENEIYNFLEAKISENLQVT
jgi:hypothetical protein